MELSSIIIILLIGIISVYIFYLMSVYIKLENRRSLILSKFTEVDNQIENKLEIVKQLNELIDNNDIKDTRINLINSVAVNKKIKYNKILDSLIEDIITEDKKVKKRLSLIKEINDKIDYAKEFYNDSLYEYNMILSTFSGKIMKKIFKYTEYNTF